MKSGIMYRVILLTVGLFCARVAFSQISVFPLSDSAGLERKSGFVYALPRTLIKVEVSVEKSEHYRGPFAEFAEKYLGLKSVISADFNEYEVKDLGISTISEPDPSQYYFVEINPKKLKKNKILLASINEAGIIRGFNNTAGEKTFNDIITKKYSESSMVFEQFDYYAGTNQVERIDTIIRKVIVDTVIVQKMYYSKRWEGKSDEQKAAEAAGFIEKIRKSRFELLTGFQEVAFEAKSLEYMDKKLKELENEYLSLFTGVTITRLLKYSFIVLPDRPGNDELQIPVFNFSQKFGIQHTNSSTGSRIHLKIERKSSSRELEDLSREIEKEKKGKNGFYYRIPEQARISLEINDQMKISGQFLVTQFGRIMILPEYISVVQFHPETGEIKSLLAD